MALKYQWKSEQQNQLDVEYQGIVKQLKSAYSQKIKQLTSTAEQQTFKRRLEKELMGLNNSYKIKKSQLKKAGSPDLSLIEGEGNSSSGPLADLTIVTNNAGTPLYEYDRSKIDINLLVYDGDRDALLEISNDQELKKGIEAVAQFNPDLNLKRELLKTSFRLSPAIAPVIYEIGDKCAQKLGLNVQIEFFVYPSPILNACIYPPSEAGLFILLSSSLVENFNKEELTFVVGHELGHYVFDHGRFPIQYIIENGGEHITPLQAMKLYAWMRNAELSADRVGLLCCENFAAAIQAFFKLSSGITKNNLGIKLAGVIHQFKDLKIEMEKGDGDPRDWYTTHPFGPLRIRALELFHNSKTYYTLLGKNGGSISEEEMEKEIKGFMDLMDPHYLKDSDTQKGKLIQEFVFLSGYAIAAANGDVDERELKALESIVSPRMYKAGLGKVKNLKTIKEVLEQLAILVGDLNVHTNSREKFNIIRDISIIVYADGMVENCEMMVLHQICALMGVPFEFADQVMAAAIRPLD